MPLTEATPDHSTLTRTRDRLDQEAHEQAFQFVLRLAAAKGLLDLDGASGSLAVGVDGTTLEANAAMRGIVRRDTGEGYKEYLRRLAAAEGVVDPTDEDLRRFDRKRKGKRCSNEEWVSPVDPEAEVARMKDKRTHLAYKAEHVVDLASELVLAAEVLPATAGDAATLVDSVLAAQGHLDAAATLEPGPRTERQVEAATGAGPRIAEVAADKGYHEAEALGLAADLGVRTYVPQPKRPQKAKGRGKAKAKGKGGRKPPRRGGRRAAPAVRNNRRRAARAKGKRLGRRRSEVVERSFAHVCETGGARRTWLRGKAKVQKRYLIVAAGRNLGLVMLRLFGVGKPRGLQGRRGSRVRLSWGLRALLARRWASVGRRWAAALARRWMDRARVVQAGWAA